MLPPTQGPPEPTPWNDLDLELEDTIDFARQVLHATRLRDELEAAWPRIGGAHVALRGKRPRRP